MKRYFITAMLLLTVYYVEIYGWRIKIYDSSPTGNNVGISGGTSTPSRDYGQNCGIVLFSL